MIKINNLRKSYDQNVVLNSMNIEIRPGTIFGLIGINGSGKSTLLRLISGVIQPDEGSIEINGQLLTDSLEERINIFYLPDNPAHGQFTTFEHLFELYNVFYSMNRTVFNEVLELFNLESNLELTKCSKGMKRQGYIALAFATEAKYLLLDEAFDGLDPVSRLKFSKYLMKSFDEDKIIIISSHSLRELEDICDSFGIIDRGHFKTYGNITDAVSKVIKYRIIASDIEKPVLKNKDDFIHSKRDGRVVTAYLNNQKDIKGLILEENILALDQLDMTFEEYFMIQEATKLWKNTFSIYLKMLS